MDSRLAKKFAMSQRRERGQRWDPPWPSQSNPATNADFIQAEIHDSLRGKRGRNLTRGRRWDPPWTVAAAPAAPRWPPQIVAKRRLMSALLRRGKRWDAPVAVVTAPVIDYGFLSEIHQAEMGKKSRRLFRGRRFDPPFIQSAILPEIRSRRPILTALRRGRYTPGVAALNAVGPLAVTTRRRIFPPLLRRGKRADVVQLIVTVPPPTGPALPANSRSRVKWYRISRGRQFSPPWVGAALNAFVWYPKFTPRRLRVIGLLAKRGRRTDALGVAAQPSALVSRKVRPIPGSRRGRRMIAVPSQERAPDRIKSRRHTARTRRGRRWEQFITQIVVVVPSAWVPSITRSRRVFAMMRLRSRFGNLAFVRIQQRFSEITTGRFDRGDQGNTDYGSEGQTDIAPPGDTDKGSEGDIL